MTECYVLQVENIFIDTAFYAGTGFPAIILFKQKNK